MTLPALKPLLDATLASFAELVEQNSKFRAMAAQEPTSRRQAASSGE